MKWDDLRYFLALARAGRLAPAARATGQDPTTVARRVQRLEESLQATLFEQTLNGYIPTAEGRRLLARAEAMESIALDAQETISGNLGTMCGSIRLSVSEGFGTRVLSQILPMFTADHPAIQLDLVATSGFLNPARREADIAITLARPKRGLVVVRHLTSYRLGLYGSTVMLRSHPAPITIDELVGQKLVGYVPDLIYAPELRYLEEIDSRLAPSVQSSSINAQAELIAAGAGYGILPCFIGDSREELTRALRSKIDLKRNFWLVVRRDVRDLARIDRFVRWILTEMSNRQPLMMGHPPLPTED